MTRVPFLSVVLTTRNRADRLPSAIQSVLASKAAEVELVVSDNGSTDATAAVVAAHADGRLRYLRTPRVLAQQDAWEFVLGHARGRYVAFLADDDALCAGYFERIAEILTGSGTEVLTWDPGFYYYSTWRGGERTNTLELFPARGDTSEVPARPTLEQIYRGGPPPVPAMHSVPLIITSAYSADLVARVKRRNGRFFLPIHVDIAACVALLTQIERFVYLHDVLSLRGRGDENASSGMYRRERGQTYLGELGDGGRFRHVALKSVTLCNASYETLLRMQAAMPAELAGLEIPPERYFAECYRDLVVLRQNGVPVTGDLREFWTAVDRLEPGARARVRAAVGGPLRRSVRRLVRPLVDRARPLQRLERRLRAAARGRQGFRKLVVRGAEAEFVDIFTCGQRLDATVREGLGRFWRGERPSPPIPGRVVGGNPWEVL
jgi:glycosyltransferase involved in cell wall biosynthesis